jgi:hypothetical protein
MQWYGEYGAGHHMRPDSVARSFQYIPGKATLEDRAHRMVQDLRRQRVAPPVGSLWESLDPQGHPEPRPLAKEVGDSADTAYHNEMYVTPKMAHRCWKEIQWWCIDARCWKATYGPSTEAWAHLNESKVQGCRRKILARMDGRAAVRPSLQPCARGGEREAGTEPRHIPDYTELVNAVVGERVAPPPRGPRYTCPSISA